MQAIIVEKPCRVCASKIPIDAGLCHVCKTYQSVWKAGLQFVSSVTALFVASISFAAWTISQLPTIRTIIFPIEDLRVVSLNSLYGGTIANQGDKEVFLSHVMLIMNRRAPWDAQRFPINESLAAGKFVKVTAPRNDDFGEGGWARGVPSSEWEKFVNTVLNDKRCFHIVFFSADDPLFRELKGFAGPSLNMLSVVGYLEYRPINADTFRRVEVPSSAVIRTNPAQDCQAKIPVNSSK